MHRLGVPADSCVSGCSISGAPKSRDDQGFGFRDYRV